MIGEQKISGMFVIECFQASDTRGRFVKTFHPQMMTQIQAQFQLREEFYSISRRNTIRGMHFQTPPFDHQKIVYCVSGRVLDVLVDLRTESPTYRQYCSLELSASDSQLVFIPRGLAHGFLALEDDSILVYKTDCEYAPDNDSGIHWNSFGFRWPIDDSDAVLSSRDSAFPSLAEFKSPF
jgi:dTDP-4-dehydrorhamnose 3,5-epimerase